RKLGHEPALRSPLARVGLDPVTACTRQVALADAVLAIVGHRRGAVPATSLGGDGLRPWTHWELESAFDHGLPVTALLSDRRSTPERESDAEAAAVMADLRGELARLGTTFADANEFRRLAHAALRELEHRRQPAEVEGGFRLRRFPPPELPARPYPVLLPYTHPRLLAGREDDLADLRRTLARRLTLVGLHAASGIGKSSLLAGGLVPTLRAEGRPVAFDRHPTEPGLAPRLIGDLLQAEEGDRPIAVPHARRFVDLLILARRLGHDAAPLLVIDQFEDLLRDGVEARLAEVGVLLAASAQRQPMLDGPACRWLLAYRQEYHGRVVQFLQDVLRGARAADHEGTADLPHDLAQPSRFLDWPLRPLATAPPAVENPLAEVTRIFRDAIEKPLTAGTDRGPRWRPNAQHRVAFPWVFADGHAARLAQAFAEARIRQPRAPLAPELQVVLAHLLDQAGEPTGDEMITVRVPANVAELIDHALEQHLCRALDHAFPRGLDRGARIARARAVLVLRELAALHGRRNTGHPAEAIERALGAQGDEILERLSTPSTRLVLRQQHGERQVYVLAHDRLAEVLVRVVDEGHWAELDVDARLLALRRFVALQTRLYSSGDPHQATAVPADRFAGIAAHGEVLLWNDVHHRWWRACQARRRADRRQRILRGSLAAAAMTLIALVASIAADRRERRRAQLEELASGEPAAAFAALERLTSAEIEAPNEALERLRQRPTPFDIFERGLGGVPADGRAAALVRGAEFALPILRDAPHDPVLIAGLVWALDFFAAPDPAFNEQATRLRHQALEALRRDHPPPPRPGAEDPHWVKIPAGTFHMGARADEGRDQPNMQDEFPRHPVTLSAFRMLTHEVTNAEYRRLVPTHPGDEDRPAATMGWHKAYTYAAWLGGRLPTEAEWEYAARAGCRHAFCQRDGGAADLSEVAWWLGNAVDPATGEPATQPVRQLEPNPFGLW
ncbi:MAG: formylglycine-generating enzyme family protein, partial [Acidobacteriota bacterium]